MQARQPIERLLAIRLESTPDVDNGDLLVGFA
jgi:hypothetical protein